MPLNAQIAWFLKPLLHLSVKDIKKTFCNTFFFKWSLCQLWDNINVIKLIWLPSVKKTLMNEDCHRIYYLYILYVNFFSSTICHTKHFKRQILVQLKKWYIYILLKITCKIVTATTDDHKCTQNQTTSPSGHIQGDISRRLSTTYLETFVCPTSFRNFIEGGTWKKGYG